MNKKEEIINEILKVSHHTDDEVMNIWRKYYMPFSVDRLLDILYGRLMYSDGAWRD